MKHCNEINNILQKYDAFVLRMGLVHLFNSGVEKLTAADIEADCAQILAHTPENAIISAEMMASIHRCAAELAKIDVIEIFKYIQTELEFDGVHVHPGKFLRFQDKETGQVITEFLVPSDVDDDTIRETANLLKPCCNMGAEMAADVISYAFSMKGIRPEPIVYDLTFEI